MRLVRQSRRHSKPCSLPTLCSYVLFSTIRLCWRQLTLCRQGESTQSFKDAVSPLAQECMPQVGATEGEFVDYHRHCGPSTVLFPRLLMYCMYVRGLSGKYPNISRKNFPGLTLKLFSLVAFKVLPSTLYAPLPAFLQCSEAFLESCFRNAAQMR